MVLYTIFQHNLFWYFVFVFFSSLFLLVGTLLVWWEQSLLLSPWLLLFLLLSKRKPIFSSLVQSLPRCTSLASPFSSYSSGCLRFHIMSSAVLLGAAATRLSFLSLFTCSLTKNEDRYSEVCALSIITHQGFVSLSQWAWNPSLLSSKTVVLAFLNPNRSS